MHNIFNCRRFSNAPAVSPVFLKPLQHFTRSADISPSGEKSSFLPLNVTFNDINKGILMKTSQSLAQLALVGIAAGFLTNAAFAGDKMPAASKDTSMSAAAAGGDSAAVASMQHECKGMNECKGMGGCKMSKKDLKAAAKKMGMPMDKAGKAHDCKTKNECKGLGGCKG
jgi:hypothetical protein